MGFRLFDERGFVVQVSITAHIIGHLDGLVVNLLEEKNLLGKISLYLYLSRKSLMGYIFALSILPLVLIILVCAFQKDGKWFWSIPMGIVWMAWILIQSRSISRRNKVGREILNGADSNGKWSSRLSKMLRISKWELICLLSIILSLFYFLPLSFFFKEYRELRKEYELASGGEKGMDIENELSRRPKMDYRRGL